MYLTISYIAHALANSLHQTIMAPKGAKAGLPSCGAKKLGGVSQISDVINDRMCGIRIQTRNNLVLNVLAIYLPAQGSPESYSASITDRSEFINSREVGSKTIICGDANGDLGDLGGPRGGRKPCGEGKLFMILFVHIT